MPQAAQCDEDLGLCGLCRGARWALTGVAQQLGGYVRPMWTCVGCEAEQVGGPALGHVQ